MNGCLYIRPIGVETESLLIRRHITVSMIKLFDGPSQWQALKLAGSPGCPREWDTGKNVEWVGQEVRFEERTTTGMR